jgi:uncharacterized membrane protein YhiD involved in acid resistance
MNSRGSPSIKIPSTFTGLAGSSMNWPTLGSSVPTLVSSPLYRQGVDIVNDRTSPEKTNPTSRQSTDMNNVQNDVSSKIQQYQQFASQFQQNSSPQQQTETPKKND